jgi:hypothetical protein
MLKKYCYAQLCAVGAGLLEVKRDQWSLHPSVDTREPTQQQAADGKLDVRFAGLHFALIVLTELSVPH